MIYRSHRDINIQIMIASSPLKNNYIQMKKTIKHQFFYPHPPEKVWDYLTKPELMEQWIMKNDFQSIVGLDFQFRTNPIPSLNFDGVFYCKVLEIVPFKKLSYSWNSGP